MLATPLVRPVTSTKIDFNTLQTPYAELLGQKAKAAQSSGPRSVQSGSCEPTTRPPFGVEPPSEGRELAYRNFHFLAFKFNHFNGSDGKSAQERLSMRDGSRQWLVLKRLPALVPGYRK